MFVASKIFALSLPHADLVFFSAELSCRNLGSGVRGKLALQTCLVSKFVHLKKHIETQKTEPRKELCRPRAVILYGSFFGLNVVLQYVLVSLNTLNSLQLYGSDFHEILSAILHNLLRAKLIVSA